MWCAECYPGELEAGLRERLLGKTPPVPLRLVSTNPAAPKMLEYKPLPGGGLFGPREVR